MSVLKTFAILCLLACLPQDARAQDRTLQPALTQIFSECAGRYSAEREHAWLTGSRDAPTYDAQRSAFISLLDATASQPEAKAALSYRIEVKLAHASLLTRANFNKNSPEALQAHRLARSHIAACQRLLLAE